MKKHDRLIVVALCAALALVSIAAVVTNKLPLPFAFLQTDMDGNSHSITNLSKLDANGITNRSLTASALEATDANKGEKSVLIGSGLTYDGTTLASSGTNSVDTVTNRLTVTTNAIIYDNLNLPYLAASKLTATDAAKNLTNADVAARLGFSGNVLDLAAVGTAGTYTKTTFDAWGRETSGTSATLASADFANQGTTTTLLHGNAAGNPSFTQVQYADIANGAIRYPTNGVNTGVLVFGNSYTTNISADITISSLTVNDSTAYESLVLVVKNTDSAPHKVTWPNGVVLIPANVAPALGWATNGVFTEMDVAHQGSVYTNVTVKN